MGRFSWIGGGLGFLLGGPMGIIVGAVLGSMVDGYRGESHQKGAQNNGQRRSYANQQSATRGDFNVSFLVLIAAVMKADGKVVRSELDYVKQYFVRVFGQESAREAIRMLGDLIKQEIPIRDVCLQITRNMDHASRLQLVHLLFGVSAADGKVDQYELNVLRKIAGYFNISNGDFESIKTMFVSDVLWPYKVLEVDQKAPNEEVKKAYRKMALKFHPDRVSHLGEEIAAQANDKFQKVNQAYEAIKKERGFN